VSLRKTADGSLAAFGERPGPHPAAPTVLLYAHYDVQPAGDESEWTTPPFQPSIRDGRIYARGATDDKGPVVVALETAKTLLADEGALPLNVRFLIEGEEEIGSPSLPAFLEQQRDALGCDLVVSADGAMWRPTEPSVAVAAKGLLERGRTVSVVTDAIETLDLPADYYDLIVMQQVIEHVHNPPAVIAKLRSSLRSGGRLVMETPHLWSWDHLLFRSRYWEGYHIPRHFNLWTVDGMRKSGLLPG